MSDIVRKKPVVYWIWLNIAEIELSALTKQCLNRRIPDKITLQVETKSWEKARNREQKGVDWRFTTEDARIKLKRLYPTYVSDERPSPLATALASSPNQFIESAS